MKYVITGGAGFIGSTMIERLIDKNEVTVFDNFCSGQMSYIEQYLNNPKFKLIKEKDIIAETVNNVKEGFSMVGIKGEIIIVDSSTDNSPKNDNIFNTLNKFSKLISDIKLTKEYTWDEVKSKVHPIPFVISSTSIHSDGWKAEFAADGNIDSSWAAKGKLSLAKIVKLSSAYKQRIQEANVNSPKTDKIEIYLSDIDAVKRKPDGKPSAHPINSGFNEILLIFLNL